MTKDDIIRMAREAGFEINEYGLLYCDEYGEIDVAEMLDRFFQAAYAAGAADEREAMVAEAAKRGLAMRNDDPFEDYVRDIANDRARGNT